jgi:hypothetical protein
MGQEYREEIIRLVNRITDERELYLVLLYTRCAAGDM